MAAVDIRMTVYSPNGSEILALDASPDLVGGGVQCEDTPSGCGAGKLTLGLFREQILARGYYAGMNLVEISAGDMRLVQPLSAVPAGGTTKVYLDSTYLIDPLYGEDAQVLYFCPYEGSPGPTMRCPVLDVGVDSTGPYAQIGTPLQGGGIPNYAAGAIVGRRIYTGRIVRRSQINDVTPTATITLVGLTAAFSQAIGSFTISAAADVDVSTAIYEALQQFEARFPFFTISPYNFEATGSTYSGSETDVGLDRWFSDCLTGISNGDQWVVRVGHDLTPRMVKLFTQASDSYAYPVSLSQAGLVFVPLQAQIDDEDTSGLFNSIEVIGDTDPLTQQPVKAIVQNTTSITDLGVQIDGAPVTNTGCKTVAECESYGQALLEQNAIPRSQNQFVVYVDDDAAPADGPGGTTRGGIIRGVNNVLAAIVELVEGMTPETIIAPSVDIESDAGGDVLDDAGAPVLSDLSTYTVEVPTYTQTTETVFGLVASVVRTIDVAAVKDYQTVQFSAIEPDWTAFLRQRNAGLATAIQANTSTAAGFAGYYTDPNSWPIPNGPPTSGLTVEVPSFFAQFATGTSPVACGGNTFTLPPSTTSFVWLNANNTWTVNSSDTVVADAIPYGVFQTSATAVIGETRRVPIGPLIPASNVQGIANQNLIVDSQQAAGIVFNDGGGTKSSAGSPYWTYDYIDGASYYVEKGTSPDGANPSIVTNNSHAYEQQCQPIVIPAGATAWISCYFDATNASATSSPPTFQMVDATTGTVYATAEAQIGTNVGGGPNGRFASAIGFTPSANTNVIGVFKMNGTHCTHFVFAEPQIELGSLPSPYKAGPLMSGQTTQLAHATMSPAVQSVIADNGSGQGEVTESTAFNAQGSMVPIESPTIELIATDTTGTGSFQIGAYVGTQTIRLPNGSTASVPAYSQIWTNDVSGNPLTATTTYYFAFLYNPNLNQVTYVAGPQTAAISATTAAALYADGNVPLAGSISARTPAIGGSPVSQYGGGGFGGRQIGVAS